VNPGGSVKDRVARNIIVEAEREGKLRPGVSKLVEATAGRHPPHFPHSLACASFSALLTSA
jgi:hypothetical protein